jgi:hypothetical protein
VEAFGEGVVALSIGDADSGSLAYTHVESFLVHREHRGVRRSQANFDFAHASHDLLSVLRIVNKGVHDLDDQKV